MNQTVGHVLGAFFCLVGVVYTFMAFRMIREDVRTAKKLLIRLKHLKNKG